jgi:hypothetical protein
MYGVFKEKSAVLVFPAMLAWRRLRWFAFNGSFVLS